MPEGHTIHRLARDLAELNERTVHASSPQGRFAAGAERLDGRAVIAPAAFGKHLFLRMTGSEQLHVHLGMQGKFFRYPDPAVPALRQARLRLATDEVAWDLIAPSRCEVLSDDQVHRLVTTLGPDPLRSDADREVALDTIAASPGPVGAVLLDQAVVAGVGNVFRNEALHAMGIHPERPASTLTRDQLDGLWKVLRQMMCRAVEDGRIITVEVADRQAVPEAEARRVYKQSTCRDCGASVHVTEVGGRTAYVCPVDQPLDPS